MNNKERRKKFLNKDYEEYPNTRNFINKLLEEINSNENLPPQQVLSICFGFLCCSFSYNL